MATDIKGPRPVSEGITGTADRPLTFRHLVAGSTFIMPNGKVITFGGKPGSPGDYTTDDKAEIAELTELVKVSNCPVEFVVDPTAEVAVTKPADPAIAQAAADAAKNTELEANPQVSAARDALAQKIAATVGGAPAK